MNNSFFDRLRTGFQYGDRPHPLRDWFVLLLAAALILGVIIVWNAWLFDRVVNGETLAGAATSTPPLFSQASLTSVEKVFTDRAALQVKYETNGFHFVDPSK